MPEGVVLAGVIAGSIVIVSITKHVTSVFKAQAREKSRREIAAYIAEGSMTPEQGERLMRADGRARPSSDAEG
jgi:uncharacterized protein YqhQ